MHFGNIELYSRDWQLALICSRNVFALFLITKAISHDDGNIVYSTFTSYNGIHGAWCAKLPVQPNHTVTLSDTSKRKINETKAVH